MAKGLRTAVQPRQIHMLLVVTGADSGVTVCKSIVPLPGHTYGRAQRFFENFKPKIQYRIDWPIGYGYDYAYCLLATIINHGMGYGSRRLWRENHTCAKDMDYT